MEAEEKHRQTLRRRKYASILTKRKSNCHLASAVDREAEYQNVKVVTSPKVSDERDIVEDELGIRNKRGSEEEDKE